MLELEPELVFVLRVLVLVLEELLVFLLVDALVFVFTLAAGASRFTGATSITLFVEGRYRKAFFAAV